MGTINLVFTATNDASQINEICPQSAANKCDLLDSVQWDFSDSFLPKADEETKISRKEGNCLYGLITDYRLGKKRRSKPLSAFSQRKNIARGAPEGPMLKPMLYLALAVIWQNKDRMRWQNLMTPS